MSISAAVTPRVVIPAPYRCPFPRPHPPRARRQGLDSASQNLSRELGVEGVDGVEGGSGDDGRGGGEAGEFEAR